MDIFGKVDLTVNDNLLEGYAPLQFTKQLWELSTLSSSEIMRIESQEKSEAC